MKRLKVFLPLFVFFACEKDQVTVPVEYVFSGFETGTIRVFTPDGEISNDLFSHKFLAHEDYFVNQNSFELVDFPRDLAIIFKSKGKSVFQGSDTVMTADVTRKSDRIYFESSDTLYSYSGLSEMTDSRLQFSPITQTNIVDAGFGGFPPIHNFFYGYRACFYAIDYENEIKIPFVSLLEMKCSTEGILIGCNESGFSNLNNAFNENYINVVKNSPYGVDTLVVQQNYVVFRKK